MPNFTPDMFIGPVSGLVISLVFAGLFFQLFNRMLQKFETVNSELVRLCQEEIAACEARYGVVLKEILNIKNNRT